jgi:hypothetical protein
VLQERLASLEREERVHPSGARTSCIPSKRGKGELKCCKSVLHPLKERKACTQVLQERLASLEREERVHSSVARASCIPSKRGKGDLKCCKGVLHPMRERNLPAQVLQEVLAPHELKNYNHSSSARGGFMH